MTYSLANEVDSSRHWQTKKKDKACLVQASAQGSVTVKDVHIFTQVCGMEKCP